MNSAMINDLNKIIEQIQEIIDMHLSYREPDHVMLALEYESLEYHQDLLDYLQRESEKQHRT